MHRDTTREKICECHPYNLPSTVKSEWADYMLSMHSLGTYQRNELTRISSGNARPQSSQCAEPLCTDSLVHMT